MSNYSSYTSGDQQPYARTSGYNTANEIKLSARKAPASNEGGIYIQKDSSVASNPQEYQSTNSRNITNLEDKKDGSKTISIYKAQDMSGTNIPEISPRDKIELNESFKNFKIVHNTSYFSPVNYQSNTATQKAEVSPLYTQESERSNRTRDPVVENILKESTQHIDKINKMLEDHRKKKALKHVNETIETLQTEPSSQVTKEYINTMKERMTPRGIITTAFSPKQSNAEPIKINEALAQHYDEPNEYLGPPTHTVASHRRIMSNDISKQLPKQIESPGMSMRSYGSKKENFSDRNNTYAMQSARDFRPENHNNQNNQNLWAGVPSSTKNQGDRSRMPIEERLMIQEMERQVRLNKLREQRDLEMRGEIRTAPKISKNSKEIIKTSKKYNDEREQIERIINQQTIDGQDQGYNPDNYLSQGPFVRTAYLPQSIKKDEYRTTPDGTTVKSKTLSRVQTESLQFGVQKGFSDRKSPTNQGSIYSRNAQERPNYQSLLKKNEASPDIKLYQTQPTGTQDHLVERIASPKHILLQLDPRASQKASTTNLSQKGYLIPQRDQKYDDVQKLEIIENNLMQIKSANLIKSSANPSPEKTHYRTQSSQSQTRSEKSRASKKPAQQQAPPKQIKLKNPYTKPQPKPTVMEIKPSTESLMESVRLRQNKFFEFYDSSLMIRDREEPPMQDSMEPSHVRALSGDQFQTKSWVDIDVYERNTIWLSARNNKLDLLNTYKLHNEMKECTFQPEINLNHQSMSRLNITSPKGASSLRPTPQKNLIDRMNPRYTTGVMGGIDGLSSPSMMSYRNRSLSKEKKALQHSYSGLHELKKVYNQDLAALTITGNNQFSPIRKNESQNLEMDLIPPVDEYPEGSDLEATDTIKVSKILTKYNGRE